MRLWAASSRISGAQLPLERHWSSVLADFSKRPVPSEDSNSGRKDLATFATREANVCNDPKFWLPTLDAFRTLANNVPAGMLLSVPFRTHAVALEPLPYLRVSIDDQKPP